MVYLFLAEGFEDMEAVVPFDLMKRVGIDVKTVGTGGKTVKSAHGLTVTADISEGEVDFGKAEAFVFPGGWPGAKNLKNSKIVNDAITFALHNDIIIGAICASPGYVLSGTVIAAREPVSYCGLNLVGLRRRGFTNEQVDTIHQAYRYIYQSGLNTSMAIERIKAEMEMTPEIEYIVSFVEGAKRGIIK